MAQTPTSLFGIIGYPLTQTFSPAYFTEKFALLGIDATHKYVKFEIESIANFLSVLEQNKNLVGLNVTSPYKQEVLQYVQQQHATVQACSAANTLLIHNSNITAYNTDVIGFQQSLLPLLKPHHTKALILGTGGASKAVAYVCKALNIDYSYVSRKAAIDSLTYQELTKAHFEEYTVIINCTPAGMVPNVDTYPAIPYQFITEKHLCYDLIYKPERTLFLKKAAIQGATIKNGFDMLIGQAEAAWKIWSG